MQAIIAVPDLKTLEQHGGVEQALKRDVCGVPLLVRTIKTAIRAGVDSLVIIWPSSVPLAIWLECQRMLLDEGINGITIVQFQIFKPHLTSNWTAIAAVLRERFLWLPWNWITHQRALQELPVMPAAPGNWSVPVVVKRDGVLNGWRVRAAPRPPARGDPRDVEAHCVGGRPVVRVLSHTTVTPNTVRSPDSPLRLRPRGCSRAATTQPASRVQFCSSFPAFAARWTACWRESSSASPRSAAAAT